MKQGFLKIRFTIEQAGMPVWLRAPAWIILAAGMLYAGSTEAGPVIDILQTKSAPGISPDHLRPVVSTTAWLACALTLVLRFYLAGAAWNWLLPEGLLSGSPKGYRALLCSAGALVIGVPSALLLSLVLSEFGVASLAWELLGSGVVTVGGLLLGRRCAPSRTRQTLALSVPGALVVFAGTAAIMHLPRCGEWMPGGWDPGIYITQGVCVGQTGTFHPTPQAHHAALTAGELPLFTKEYGAFPQIFPGVPLDAKGRQVRHYFFRLTPTLVSVLMRCGGLAAATRVNFIMGLLGLIVFAAFLRIHRLSSVCLAIALLLLIAHPLWLYHLHLPTSEMTELFLVLGLGMLMGVQREGWFSHVVFLMLMLAAIVNRVSFVPFAGMLVLALSWADMQRTDRQRVLVERLLQILVICLGTFYDFTATAVTMANLQFVSLELIIVAGTCLVIAGGLELMLARGVNLRLLSPPILFSCFTAALMLLGLGAVMLPRHVTVLAAVRQNATHILPFLGPWLAVTAAAGLAVLWFVRAAQSRHLAALMVVFVGVTVILLINSYAIPIYPWATRRYLPFTVPLLAVGASIALSYLWDMQGRWKLSRRLGAGIVAGALLVIPAKKSWHAVTGTEYDGLSRHLAELAAHIEPGDLILSDHFKWGTPMAFVYGKHVLDGSQLHGKRGGTLMPAALATLARLRSDGWRVLLLTSTPEGLDVYPRKLEGARLLWAGDSFVIKEIIHSPRAEDFARRERPAVFRLYELP